MRVLHLANGNLFGGIETMLLTLARHRAECPSMDPAIALVFDGRLSRELREAEVPVHILGAARASRPHSVLRARRQLKEILRRSTFDVAVTHGPWAHAVLGPAIRRSGVPVVFWAHGAATGRHWIERWASRTPPEVAIGNSQFTAESLPALFPACRRAVIHCPVPRLTKTCSSPDREWVRRELMVPVGSSVILHASRLEAGKGHRTLVQALGLLLNRRDWVAWFAGYPQTSSEVRYRDYIRALAQSLGVESRLRFYETKGSIRFLFEAADIFCQPNSVPDSFGIALVEAMLARLPVVTSDLGGPREFIDESCGVRVPVGDSHGVAASLARLLDDGALRLKMGEAGLQRASEWFDPRRQLWRLEEVLASVLPAPAGGVL